MKLFEIGKIVRAHGIKGNVKVVSYLEDADFSKFKHVFVGDKNTSANIVTCQNLNNDAFSIKLDISKDANMAEELKNKSILIDREEYPFIKNKIYLSDCLGFPLLDENGEKLGELVDYEDYGASVIFIIKSGVVSYQIPYVDEIVKLDAGNMAFITTKQKFEDMRV